METYYLQKKINFKHKKSGTCRKPLFLHLNNSPLNYLNAIPFGRNIPFPDILIPLGGKELFWILYIYYKLFFYIFQLKFQKNNIFFGFMYIYILYK